MTDHQKVLKILGTSWAEGLPPNHLKGLIKLVGDERKQAFQAGAKALADKIIDYRKQDRERTLMSEPPGEPEKEQHLVLRAYSEVCKEDS